MTSEDRSFRPRTKKLLKYSLALAVTILALWLSYRKIDGLALKTMFPKANYFWVVLAVLNNVFSVYVLSWRWRILLNAKDRNEIVPVFHIILKSPHPGG